MPHIPRGRVPKHLGNGSEVGSSPPDTPWAAWRRGAAAASDEQLALCTLLGVAAAAVAAFLHRWWVLVLPFIAVGGFGLAGIATREEGELRSSGHSSQVLIAALILMRWTGVAVVVLSVLIAMRAFLALALGRLIS
ncbi:MAG: hypothetical protein NVS4B3_19750 [Gemmatimonadaceae bacterium]